MGLTKDARDLLIECCVEFITLISSEANEISEKESKKTIGCEHITKALEQLGFGDYVQDIMEVANEHKEQLKVGLTCLTSAHGAYLRRDEKKRPTNSSRAVCLRNSCWLCRRRRSRRLLSGMVDFSFFDSFPSMTFCMSLA